MSSYVARPHVLADEFIPGYLGDSFGLLPFVHGDPLSNQFDGPFLVRLIRKEVTHISGFPFGIESRDPDMPSCCHLRSRLIQAGPLPAYGRLGKESPRSSRRVRAPNSLAAH